MTICEHLERTLELIHGGGMDEAAYQYVEGFQDSLEFYRAWELGDLGNEGGEGEGGAAAAEAAAEAEAEAEAGVEEDEARPAAGAGAGESAGTAGVEVRRISSVAARAEVHVEAQAKSHAEVERYGVQLDETGGLVEGAAGAQEVGGFDQEEGAVEAKARAGGQVDGQAAGGVDGGDDGGVEGPMENEAEAEGEAEGEGEGEAETNYVERPLTATTLDNRGHDDGDGFEDDGEFANEYQDYVNGYANGSDFNGYQEGGYQGQGVDEDWDAPGSIEAEVRGGGEYNYTAYAQPNGYDPNGYDRYVEDGQPTDMYDDALRQGHYNGGGEGEGDGEGGGVYNDVNFNQLNDIVGGAPSTPQPCPQPEVYP